MNIQSVQHYMSCQLDPYVQDILYRLRQEFTCGELWTGPSIGLLAPRRLHAAPLPPDARDTHGYGRRTGSAILISVTADVALGEFTWHITTDFPTQKGSRNGIVKLESTMSVRFGIAKGLSKRFELGDNQSRDGWLCWAEEYTLADSSRVFRLDTAAGMLWLRSANQEPADPKRRPLSHLLEGHLGAIEFRGHQLVHLAESTFSFTYPDRHQAGYWRGFTTRDESGRPWRIEQDTMHFGADCRLELMGRPNDRLSQRRQLKLEPPYEAVWSPPNTEPNEEPLLIPFQLS